MIEAEWVGYLARMGLRLEQKVPGGLRQFASIFFIKSVIRAESMIVKQTLVDSDGRARIFARDVNDRTGVAGACGGAGRDVWMG